MKFTSGKAVFVQKLIVIDQLNNTTTLYPADYQGLTIRSIATDFAGPVTRIRREQILNESEKPIDKGDIMKPGEAQGKSTLSESPQGPSKKEKEESNISKLPPKRNTSGPLENSPPDHSNLGKVKGGERAPYEIGDLEEIQSDETLHDIVRHAVMVVNDPRGHYSNATRHMARLLVSVYNYMEKEND